LYAVFSLHVSLFTDHEHPLALSIKLPGMVFTMVGMIEKQISGNG